MLRWPRNFSGTLLFFWHIVFSTHFAQQKTLEVQPATIFYRLVVYEFHHPLYHPKGIQEATNFSNGGLPTSRLNCRVPKGPGVFKGGGGNWGTLRIPFGKIGEP